MTKLLALATMLGITAVVAGSAFAGGPPGASFYVDGTLYRTVGTPTDFTRTGAPASSFDTIYQFQGAQPFNVATAAPGDRDFNGGRWRVQFLTFPSGYQAALMSADANDSGDIDSDAELATALADGTAVVDVDHPPVWFECPVIPLSHGKA
jgi:hypothetical protein